jgi:coatomer protein complex subunit gamma
VPSEEAFDIDSVSKEGKSQQHAEKKAPGKKPPGLGAPPSDPLSTAYAYQRVLSSIPEFANFGILFKVHRFDCSFTNLYLLFVPSMAKTIYVC